MKKGKFLFFLLVLIISITSIVSADTLEYGSKGQEVGKLQTQLKSLGYFKSNVTNYFGSATKAAVKKFQASKGIVADGVAGQQTTKYLFKNGTSSRSTASRVEESGLSKEQLKKVQTILKNMNLYKGKIDGLYGKQTSAAVKEFQKKYGVKSTGIIDEETGTKILNYKPAIASSRGGSNVSKSQTSRIEAVNAVKKDTAVSEADSNNKIEVLDWWTEANKVFARGTVAKVIDVRTGKSFNIKRTYGSNHADSETLTAEDTKIMKEIWGGNFNWSRRPVILEIDGRLLAASMAGMPHAGLDNKPINATVSSRSGGFGRGTNLDTIKNNNMDGHFDVHFKNSRTHGSNRVDSAHQKAIKEAAAAKL